MNRRTDRRTNTHGNNVHRDRRRHAVSTSDVTATCGLYRDKWTNEWESNLVHFSLKMWHLVEKMLTNFLTINWPNFVYFYWLIADFIPPFKFLWSIAVRSPIGWTPLTDTADKETNEQTNGRTNEETHLSSSVRLLDGVWHTWIKPMSWFRRGDWWCLQSLHRG